MGAVVDLVAFPPPLAGDVVGSAAIGSAQDGRETIDLTLAPAAAALFAPYTAGHVGESFTIAVDGRALSVPVIREAISDGRDEVSSGSIDWVPDADAPTLVALVRSGPVPMPLVEVASGAGG